MDSTRLRSLFGKRLRNLRRSNKLIQAELAEQTGISVDHLSNLERGLASPSFALIERLAGHFTVSPALFFAESEASAEAEAAAVRSRLYAQAFMECIDPILIQDLSGVVIDVNEEAEAEFGWTRDELVGKSSRMLVPEELHDVFEKHLSACREGALVRNVEVLRKRKGGGVFHALLSLSLLRDEQGKPACIASVMKNIDALKEYERRVVETLEEREYLLREIHHRVRNNLQIVISLLDFASWGEKDDMCKASLRKVGARLQAMGLVHNQLYESGRLDKVDLASFVKKHSEHLVNLFEADRIETVYHLEPLKLSIAKAIPFALVFNEVMSNAIRHAYPDQDSGRVDVRLAGDAAGALHLTVADEGCGLPEDVDPEASESVGFKIMRTIVDKQLDGDIRFFAKDGLTVSIEFGNASDPN